MYTNFALYIFPNSTIFLVPITFTRQQASLFFSHLSIPVNEAQSNIVSILPIFLAKKISKIDTIFHCASMTGIDKCEKNKEACWKTNVIGTRNIIELKKT